MDYVTENCDKDLVKKLNAAMREGKYAPELWKTYTGKTVDELWADYVKTLKKRITKPRKDENPKREET